MNPNLAAIANSKEVESKCMVCGVNYEIILFFISLFRTKNRPCACNSLWYRF